MSYNPSAANSGAYASNVYVPGQQQQQQQAGQTMGGVYVPGGSNPAASAPAPAYNPLMAQFQKAQKEQKEQFRQSHVQAGTNPTPEPKPVVSQTVASSVTESTRAEPAAAAAAPVVEEPAPAPAPAKPAKPASAPKPFVYTGPPKPEDDEPTTEPTTAKPSKPTAGASSAGGHYGGNNEASFKKEFDKIDKDNNGYISEQELGKLFFNKIPPNLLKQAIGFIDKNKDGKISFDEYKAIRSQLGEIKIPGFLGGGKK